MTLALASPAANGAPTGRRIRMPVPLVLSPHHTAKAVALWALLDVMGGPSWGVTANRNWLATRLDMSLSSVKRALAALHHEHTGAGAVPSSSAFLVSRVRGRKLTAERETVRGIPFVDVPEWTLGETGPLVPHESWRLYVVILHKRHEITGAVTLPRADLARLLHVEADRIPEILAPLVAAGMLATRPRPGKETVLAPILARTAEARAAAEAALDAADGPRRPVENLAAAVDDGPESVENLSTPHPSNEPSPHPSNEPSPHPPNGPSIGGPNYKTRTNETRSRAARASAASRHAHHSEEPAPRRLLPLARWCGLCHGPRSRVLLDPETALPTGEACHRCATPPADGTVAA